MKVKDDKKFIMRVEQLIDPAEVCDLYFLQRFKKLLPRETFKKLLVKTSKKTPYLGFVIDPYCTFLFFKLKDIERAKAMLPERYELIKSSVFADEEPDYYHGMGIFNARASTFWGARLESYLIARDKETGLVSWIFIDILSNTLIARPREGVADRNCRQAVCTTNSKGELFIDFMEEKTGRGLRLKGLLTRGVSRPLDQPLWIGGNTSVAHSVELTDTKDDPFAVIFDPAEVIAAQDIPLEDMHLEFNNLFPGLAESELCRVICFPYAQHYIADSPGCRTYIKDTESMVQAYNRIAELPELNTFSTKDIKRQALIGLLVSWPLVAVVTMLLLRLFG